MEISRHRDKRNTCHLQGKWIWGIIGVGGLKCANILGSWRCVAQWPIGPTPFHTASYLYNGSTILPDLTWRWQLERLPNCREIFLFLNTPRKINSGEWRYTELAQDRVLCWVLVVSVLKLQVLPSELELFVCLFVCVVSLIGCVGKGKGKESPVTGHEGPEVPNSGYGWVGF
jgi:hypothetical protein